ncbi:hypothetical protein [Nocardioides sp. cx-173]|uniref:hypothetical protein n=1 Tax=Nocardioides sp. cx-173 TaxID=2898796 RepID=UPI001E3A0304|nr:hypothetical protein [Nocardioides sp. cx-173]MCD4524131.1 hypothetical protein [Nocardioides sp. cx-173]UGB41527.1 hypothetical protein LQ940_19490 [Nocardioides sp. cx-173]
MADAFDLPLNLRPSRRPGLMRALVVALVAACAAVLLGTPVWVFMHGSAEGWVEDRPVTAVVAHDARCRVGPPPEEARTCAATWGSGEGDVSDRYGGPAPMQGERVEARAVGDGLALTGFHPVLLGWAVASPYLTLAGLVVAGGAVAGLVRHDPRWSARRTELPSGGPS